MKAVIRYHREYDRYLKLAARVTDICRTEVVEGNAIHTQVTFQVKSPKNLEGKLRRFSASNKKNFPNVDSVFREVRDKQLTDALSEQERSHSLLLGHAVRQGDIIIGNLYADTEQRQREQGGAFTDMFDFVARVRGWFPNIDFGRHAGPLFEALQPIRLVSPYGIRKVVNISEPMTDGAQRALDEFAKELSVNNQSKFVLDRESSDLLLALLLPAVAKHLASSGVEPTSDGITRIRWLAARYLELHEESR